MALCEGNHRRRHIHSVTRKSVFMAWRRHVPSSTGFTKRTPDSKVHGADMGHTWGRQNPGGSHVGHMNLAIWHQSPGSVLCGYNDTQYGSQLGNLHLLLGCISWLASWHGSGNVNSHDVTAHKESESANHLKSCPMWSVLLNGHASTTNMFTLHLNMFRISAFWSLIPMPTHTYSPNRTSWWLHQMETFSALLAFCAGNSPVTGQFPAQRPVTRSFDVFFDLCLNKCLSKQSWGWWFETPSRPLWCDGNVTTSMGTFVIMRPQWWLGDNGKNHKPYTKGSRMWSKL